MQRVQRDIATTVSAIIRHTVCQVAFQSTPNNRIRNEIATEFRIPFPDAKWNIS